MIKRLALVIATLSAILLTGCAVGMLTEPVTKEFSTTATKFDATWGAAVKTMAATGTVTSMSKDDGILLGTNDLGVLMTITVKRDGHVAVIGRLVGQKVLINTTVEAQVDRYITALKSSLNFK